MVILCTIDLETREVSLPAGQVIASYDHNVDVIRFQAESIPGFSLDTSSIKVAAQGPNKARHDYAVDPSTVAIEEETGYITFDWPIPAGVTEMPIGTFKYGDKGQLIFAVCAEIISGSTVSKAWHSDDGIITVVAHLEPESGGGEDPEEEATNAQKIAQLQTNVAVMGTQIGALANGSPTPVETVAEMTDESAVYLYTGSETGYTAGNWYFWNGTAWTSGGTYGGAVTSTTFNQRGVPADDFAVGEALAEKADSSDVTALEGSIEAIEDALENKADKSDLENLDMVQIADDFSASKKYAIGDYTVYNKKLYRCITAITTAGAWDSSKWIEISVMGDLGSRLDMLVTMQEIREDEDEPTSEIVQLINPEWITWQTVSSEHRAKISQRIPLKGNGVYYDNPYRAESTDPAQTLYNSKFYNAFGEPITFTKQGATETRTSFRLFVTYGCRFKISDGNVLTIYVRGNEQNGVWVGDSEIAYMGADAGSYIYFGLAEEHNVGITYGGYSTTYVPYEGSAPVITHEYQYVPAMAEYVQRYMQIYGTAASNAMFKRFYPDEDKSLAVNAFRYWHDRAEREDRGVIRVASFNKFISRQAMNWPVMKQELADYSVDICGFQEATNILRDGKRIEEFMLGYQFTDGSDFSFETYNFNNGTGPGKAIVSHWTVTDTDVFTLVTTDRGVQSAVRCKMTIPSGKWFSNYVNSDCTLSVYAWHGVAYNGTVDGVSKTSLEIRQMEITALLAIMAQDTSDFIVVVADTNCFEDGLDIQNNTHVEWEMFRTAGYTPILPGIESTVTADNASTHYHIDGNGTAFCDTCYDQIFVSSHITAEGYKVVDSNLYPVPAASNAPVSDHCMIYADLKFDFDAIMQEKLIEKMGV
jgi:hypothetical protein